MRKSQSHRRAIAACAGISVGAVSVALLVAPQAAFAVDTVANKTIVAAGGGITLTDSDVVTGSRGIATTAASCPAAYSATSPAVVLVPSTASPAGPATYNNGVGVTISALPAGVTAGTNNQLKKWNLCVYTSDQAGNTLVANSTIFVGVPPTTSPTVVPTGGGATLNVTAANGSPIFTGVTTIGSQFATGECPATYGAPTANLATTVTRGGDSTASLTVPAGVVNTTAAPTPYTLCLYSGSASSSALISFVPVGVTALTLNQQRGTWAGGNGLDVTSPLAFLAGVDEPGVLFRYDSTGGTACPANYDPAATAALTGSATPATGSVISNPDNVRKLSNNRLAVTVPGITSVQPTTPATVPLQMCVYNGRTSSSTLVAQAPYAVTTVQSASAITPNAGPALGGSRITVSGANFPTDGSTFTATLGGAPLTGIEVINQGAFTALTPRHAPENNVALVVTTDAGSHTLQNAYTYTSALQVTPNTAPNTRVIDVVVKGVGFQSAPWDNAGPTTLTGAHLYLVEGRYSGNDDSNGDRANPPVAECLNVLVLSDIELICRLNLTRRLNAEGDDYLVPLTTDTIAVVNTTVGSTVITATAVDEEMIGMTVAQSDNANIPAGARIVDVINDTTAVLSVPATATGAGSGTLASVPLLPSAARTASIVTGNASDTITADTGVTFSQADVGRYVVGTNIPDGRYITAVDTAANPDTATLSGVSGASPGTATMTLYNRSLPVPEGAYNLTYVSSGAVDPNLGTLVQSSVSSGSTFTVAPF